MMAHTSMAPPAQLFSNGLQVLHNMAHANFLTHFKKDYTDGNGNVIPWVDSWYYINCGIAQHNNQLGRERTSRSSAKWSTLFVLQFVYSILAYLIFDAP